MSPTGLSAREANAARIRDTTVADAMRFYGASPMTAAYALGDPARQVKVQSIYTQLVPSSRTERANGPAPSRYAQCHAGHWPA